MKRVLTLASLILCTSTAAAQVGLGTGSAPVDKIDWATVVTVTPLRAPGGTARIEGYAWTARYYGILVSGTSRRQIKAGHAVKVRVVTSVTPADQ